MVDLSARRRAYAEELRAIAHLGSEPLVEALARVPRERFLGPGPWQVVGRASLERIDYQTTVDDDPQHLYQNVMVAIDAGRLLNNGQPAGLAQWIDRLDLKGGERVVHVGCGTGYYTAVLAEIVGPTGRVVAVEIDAPLAHRAKMNLSYLPHVDVRVGDGGQIDPGMVDAIFVNAGATHPQPIWLDSLPIGGRLLLPITSATGSGIGFGGMFLITRHSEGFAASCVSSVAIFSCIGARDSNLDRELSGKRGSESRVRSLRRDRHGRDDTCWLHLPGGCLSTRP